MENQLGHGANRDLADVRDYQYDHLVLGAPQFDWRVGYDIELALGFKLPVKHQNGSLSCVGQATATLAYVLNAFELQTLYGYGERLQKAIPELSAKSIYSQIALFGGRAYIRDAMKLLVNYGVNREIEVPSYYDGRPPTERFIAETSWKNDELKLLASNFKAKEYRTIRSSNSIDLVAEAITMNGGVILGVDGENNGTWTSKFPVPPLTTEWGHAMYAGKARLINGKRYIGVLNSWGEDIGENGWQWLGEEWFTSGHVFSPWTVVDTANTEWVKLIDKRGKPRRIPVYMLKTIRYLLNTKHYELR